MTASSAKKMTAPWLDELMPEVRARISRRFLRPRLRAFAPMPLVRRRDRNATSPPIHSS
jgi:hypothetical protein